jgi:hypothetical protein
MGMKNYQGGELRYRPSAEELDERKQSTMSRKYEKYIIGQNFYFGGYQTKYRFPNGYGASVFNNNASRGLELAVFFEEKLGNNISITSDALGFIENEEELDKLLKQIKES